MKHMLCLFIISILCLLQPEWHVLALTTPPFAKTVRAVDAQATYEVEPNDSKGQADWVQTAKPAYGKLQQKADQDYWKWKAPANGILQLDLSQIPSGQNYDLYLYDTSGKALGHSTNAGTSPERIARISVKRNIWYYIQVTGAGESFDKDTYYHLLANYAAADAPKEQGPDPFESNNSFAEASPLPSTSPQTANFHTASDIDYYRFDLKLSATLDILLDKLPKGIDADLYLYDKSQTLIAQSENASNKAEKLSYSADAGSYYLKAVLSKRSTFTQNSYQLTVNDNTMPVILIPGIGGSRLSAKAPISIGGAPEKEAVVEAWVNVPAMLLNPTDSLHRRLLTLKPLTSRSIKVEPKDERVSVFPEPDDDGFKALAYLSYFQPTQKAAEQYHSMIEHLQKLGYKKGTTLFAFPYDWRLSNSDNAVHLKKKIDQALTASQAKQVQLVVHSMGGLLAKETLLASVSYQKKTKRLIYMGTPFLGSPRAYQAIKLGYNFGIGSDVIPYHPFSEESGRLIAEYAPAVYELLPSEMYVKKQSYLTISGEKSKRSLNYAEINKDARVKLSYRPMVSAAEHRHEKWDTKPLYVPQYRIIGDSQLTLMGYEYIEASKQLRPVFGGDGGDGTVPLISGTHTMKDVKKTYYTKEAHAALPKNPYVIQQVAHLLLGIEDVQHGMRTTVAKTTNARYLVLSQSDGKAPDVTLTIDATPYRLSATAPQMTDDTPQPFRTEWHRNFLVIDLTNIASSAEATLKANPSHVPSSPAKSQLIIDYFTATPQADTPTQQLRLAPNQTTTLP